MSAKPENTFIQSVHRHLPRAVYHEKMANPYRGGTPDVWYSGSRRDLWVEYKYVPAIPRENVLPACSPLQLQWLRREYDKGRAVRVIVGCPTGGVLFADGEWEAPLPSEDFQARVLPRPGLAAWISEFTQGSL